MAIPPAKPAARPAINRLAGPWRAKFDSVKPSEWGYT